MSTDTCFADTDLDTTVKLTEEEMVALFMNMIAFDGDWDAHLSFLDDLEPSVRWKFEQIPVVRSLQYKDLMHGIQAAIT
ncbi:MAG: hypothetical protein ACYTG7_04310 [Planctomycetota bacterium]|jgi:hypothetical protein